MNSSKNFRRLIAAILVLSLFFNILFGAVAFTPLISFIVLPLIHSEKPRTAEAIVILSSGAYSNNLLDFESIIRLHRGVELFRAGNSEKVICLGGVRPGPTGDTIANIMRDELVFYGVPPGSIIAHGVTTNTYLDITSLIESFRDKFDFNQVIFVTSAHHTLRVKLILKKMGFNSQVVSALPYETMVKYPYQRISAATSVFREYGAMIYFYMRNYI